MRAPGLHPIRGKHPAAAWTATMTTRILYVDDEDDLRTLVQCQLSLEGYAVEVAPDGLTAIEMLESSSYDLVLLDLHMPGMDGAEVMQQLRQRNLNPKVVILTGDNPAEAGAKCRRFGVEGYLTKPFHFSDLAATINHAVTPAGTSGRTHANS